MYEKLILVVVLVRQSDGRYYSCLNSLLSKDDDEQCINTLISCNGNLNRSVLVKIVPTHFPCEEYANFPETRNNIDMNGAEVQ